jgi:hypothetical protein
MKTRTKGYIKQIDELLIAQWILICLVSIWSVANFIEFTYPTFYPITFESFQHKSASEYIYQEAERAGVDPIKTSMLIQCESRFDRYAINFNRNGTKDIGLFQINDINGVSDECRFNVNCSMNWAFKEIKKNGYKHWVCGKILHLDNFK